MYDCIAYSTLLVLCVYWRSALDYDVNIALLVCIISIYYIYYLSYIYRWLNGNNLDMLHLKYYNMILHAK